MTDQEAERARAKVAAFVAFYDEVVADIKAVQDLQQSFEIATELGDRIGKIRTRNSHHRAEIAHNIYRSESLSLAGLAQRIGISRGRAQDLVELARTTNPEPEEEKTNG